MTDTAVDTWLEAAGVHPDIRRLDRLIAWRGSADPAHHELWASNELQWVLDPSGDMPPQLGELTALLLRQAGDSFRPNLSMPKACATLLRVAFDPILPVHQPLAWVALSRGDCPVYLVPDVLTPVGNRLARWWQGVRP